MSVEKRPHKEVDVNGQELTVRFSEPVIEAFYELANAVQNSKHFDSETRATLRAWGNGESSTVQDLIISFALVAEQMADHVSATKDEEVKDIWRGLCTQIPERGFTVSQSRERKR